MTSHTCNDEVLEEKRNGNRNAEVGHFDLSPNFLFQTPKMLQHLKVFCNIGFFTRNFPGKKETSNTLGFQLPASIPERPGPLGHGSLLLVGDSLCPGGVGSSTFGIGTHLVLVGCLNVQLSEGH